MALRGGFQKDVFQDKMFFSIGCNCSPVFHAVLKAGWCMSAHQREGWFAMKFSVCQWLFQEPNVPVGPLPVEMNVLFYTHSNFRLCFTGKIKTFFSRRPMKTVACNGPHSSACSLKWNFVREGSVVVGEDHRIIESLLPLKLPGQTGILQHS